MKLEINELIIKNAKIVSSISTNVADIVVNGGKINGIIQPGSGETAEKVIDAKGLYVIPGCVDGHTHMMDPGHIEREDFTTGTMAAAVGGITTVVDHHRTIPEIYSLQPLLEKIEYLNQKSCVDFGLKAGISPTNCDELESLWNAGITGFKTFTCNLHGVKSMSTHVLLRSFSEVSRINGTVLIHCEDDGTLEFYKERLQAEGRTDYMSQWIWRNKAAERIAAFTVIEIAKATKCRVVIAHVSQPEILRWIKEASDQGFEIFAESCPHYFHLTTEDLARKGPWVKFTPPMNTPEKREELWRLLDKGYVTTIGSDHCPYPKEEKRTGESNIWNAPNGIPGIETSLKLMLSGVNQGKTTLNRVVEIMCENPAKIYGLFPQKGTISIGSDADIVILDMEKEEVISNQNIASKCGWSPFDGYNIKGAPITTLVRGKVVVDNGHFIGEAGYGKYVHRLSTRSI